jgi:hypothetical protein
VACAAILCLQAREGREEVLGFGQHATAAARRHKGKAESLSDEEEETVGTERNLKEGKSGDGEGRRFAAEYAMTRDSVSGRRETARERKKRKERKFCNGQVQSLSFSLSPSLCLCFENQYIHQRYTMTAAISSFSYGRSPAKDSDCSQKHQQQSGLY